MEWINLTALCIIPIVAVWVGQRLQDRSEKRKDKMRAFETLMADRYGSWSLASVNVFNTIDVVFEDESIVLDRWEQYYNKLRIQEPTEEQQQEIEVAKFQLLAAMANCLGYQDKITLETIQKTYLPNWVVDRANKQRRFEDAQLFMMEYFAAMATKQIKQEQSNDGQNENGNP